MSDSVEKDVHHEDFAIASASLGHDAFVVVHRQCAERVLYTEFCHLDTLVRIATEHTCPIPPESSKP